MNVPESKSTIDALISVLFKLFMNFCKSSCFFDLVSFSDITDEDRYSFNPPTATHRLANDYVYMYVCMYVLLYGMRLLRGSEISCNEPIIVFVNISVHFTTFCLPCCHYRYSCIDFT